MEVEIEPGMFFWVDFDRDLVGARNENGFIAPDQVESALDRRGILDPLNREVAKQMLDAIAAGRNHAMNERIEPERRR